MFAAEHLRDFPQSKVCEILSIPKSTLYYIKNHPPKQICTKEEKHAVIEVFHQHHGSFGRRVIRTELHKCGIYMSEQKISKILKNEGLRAKYGRPRGKNLHTHKKTEEKYIAENRYAKLSENEKSTMTIWSMDFTEVKVNGEKITTCGVISTREKVLVNLMAGVPNNSQTACQAIREAIKKHGKPDMIMTDRGSPFTSKKFKELLEKENITHSMSRPHTPTDNCYIESFWKSMKVETGNVEHLDRESYICILNYYRDYYNYERPHSTLGYCAPLASPEISVI